MVAMMQAALIRPRCSQYQIRVAFEQVDRHSRAGQLEGRGRAEDTASDDRGPEAADRRLVMTLSPA
jgi:hypothetical protein